jgi:hypothetical protein
MNAQQTDVAKAEMDLFEVALETLTPSELVLQLEELTTVLACGDARTGDYEKQMRTRRVIIRKLSNGGAPQ